MLEIKLPDYTEETIKKFIKDFVGNRGVVVGLSGGIDSAVVTKLCADSLGVERVLAVHMPEKTTPPDDTEDAREFAKSLGVEYREISIDDILQSYLNVLSLGDRVAIGNLKARIRMNILYAIANEEGRMVAGSSNKSELLVGYFTKYGDGASDFMPIGDLYKTQVRQLARKIGIPEKIINKVPRAGLWENQTDEGEMGVDYETLDKILYLIEMDKDPEEIPKILNIPKEVVDRVYGMYMRSKHKRILIYIPKISRRTVAFDWRE